MPDLDTSLARALRRHLPEHLAAIWLVGGCVRDRLLHRPTADLDLILPGAVEAARRFARRAGGAFVLLDAERGTARVVVGAEGWIDFSEPIGGLLEDLQHRDFTINAMACPLEAWEAPEPDWIDPCGGRDDLRAGLVRAVTSHSLLDDPLRCLRAHRFAAELGFAIEADTRDLIRSAAGGLEGVAAERVLQEWLPLLATGRAAEALARLEADGVLAALLPGVDGAGSAVAAADRIAEGLCAWPRLATALAGGDARAMLRFAAACGPERPDPDWLIQRFALSRWQRRRLAALRVPLDDGWPRHVLAAAVLARGDAVVGALAVTAARGAWSSDRIGEWAEALALHVLPAYDAPPLVTGEVLQGSLSVAPGPAFGRAMAAARLAQVAGEVTDVRAALAVAAAALESDG